MLIFQGVSYHHPNKDILFSDVHFTIERRDKIALIGNNGMGKSTLLKLMAGQLQASAGAIRVDTPAFYVPQLFDRYNELTVAQALGIADTIDALNRILAGNMAGENMELLDDDWGIEERCRDAFRSWDLEGLRLDTPMRRLSGGEKTKVFLAGIAIRRPGIILLDEPSNHLDQTSRTLLYEYISSTKDTVVVVSHDRTLLQLLPVVWELSKRGIAVYGGNYEFYAAQKAIGDQALEQELRNREKELRKAKATARETLERQQKLDARGKAKQEKAGLPTIAMKTFKNVAEKSTARTKEMHAEKVDGLANDVELLRKELPDPEQMRMDLDNSSLHRGKLLIAVRDVGVLLGGRPLWREPLHFEIRSGERIAIKGSNGAGKTTLIKLLLGELPPTSGLVDRAGFKTIYIDQDYSLIDGRLTVLGQAQQYNSGGLQDHEIKIRLTRFLFSREDWDKPCHALSGGEKMRLVLCSLTIGQQAPDMIVLDEPTNNLDIRNLEILTGAINEYRGTLLVVAHDARWLEDLDVQRAIELGTDKKAGGSVT